MPIDPMNLDPNQAKAFYQQWQSKIDDALKREKDYRAKAQKVVDLYEAKKADDTPFAIVYSNTETMLPAIYNAKPIPIVSRRFKDADPLGKVVAETSTRILKYLIEAEACDYDPYDDCIQAACLDGLLTNRGVTRFKFVADSGLPECVFGESVRWDKFFHGYARSWRKVPFIGFEWDMSEDEVRKNFPDKALNFDRLSSDTSDDANNPETKTELTGVKTYKVYEIWDKASRRVMFFSPCCPSGPLRVVEDPLNLSGFYPIPRPLNFMRKVTTLLPTPLYEHYRQQAQELNEITRRLKAIIKAIRFRGAYNSAVEGIEKMLSAEDNELVPVENVQSMPDGTGMDKLLWTVPVNELAATAQSLYQQRESIKQVIYEITGISDILRGASQASETATAQNIKNQWGSLRLKKMQKEVQRYCRDSLAIMLEIAGGKFEPNTIKMMTGLPYMTGEQKMQFQQAQQQYQRMAQQAQAVGQQPPPPPNIPLEVQDAMQLPSWEEIVSLMRNGVMLHYKTDVETNSTIDAEAAQDKQDIGELLSALSQFLNGLGPLVQEGVLSIDIAKAMLLIIARRYTFGPQLEDAINAMTAPQPKADPKAQADAQSKQIDLQVQQAKAQAETQRIQLQMQQSKQEFEQQQALSQLDWELKEAELALKKQELQMQAQMLALKAQAETAKHNQRMQQIAANAKATEAKEKEPA